MKNLFKKLIGFLIRAFAREPFIDQNAKCPNCGARAGKLFHAIAEAVGGGRTSTCGHECQVCQAKWYESSLVAAEKWIHKETLARARTNGLLLPRETPRESPLQPK